MAPLTLPGAAVAFALAGAAVHMVSGDAWSKELPGSKDLIGDWFNLKCGNYNTKTKKCGGQGS